jgi:hypothetical protein
MLAQAEKGEEKGEATQAKKANRKARTRAREEKGKKKEMVTGANTVPVAPRTILQRPEATRWERMEIMKRWREGTFTKEEEEIVSGATSHLCANEKGETPAVGNPIRQEVLRALQKWWDERHSRGAAPPGVPTGEKEARTVRTSTPARTTAVPRATVPGVVAAPRAPP